MLNIPHRRSEQSLKARPLHTYTYHDRLVVHRSFLFYLSITLSPRINSNGNPFKASPPHLSREYSPGACLPLRTLRTCVTSVRKSWKSQSTKNTNVRFLSNGDECPVYVSLKRWLSYDYSAVATNISRKRNAWNVAYFRVAGRTVAMRKHEKVTIWRVFAWRLFAFRVPVSCTYVIITRISILI